MKMSIEMGQQTSESARRGICNACSVWAVMGDEEFRGLARLALCCPAMYVYSIAQFCAGYAMKIPYVVAFSWP